MTSSEASEFRMIEDDDDVSNNVTWTESDNSRLREKQFLLSCERGDIGSVRKLLAGISTETFNINCLDPLGRNALLIAIENENIEMIELLLDHNIETGDAILYAIGEENVEAVEIIVEHLEKMDKFDSERQGVEITEHSAFTPDITPIVLAAHKDNYECIKLFLDKKGTVPHPHDVRCSCPECYVAREEDSLRLSRSRINAYRALTSPSLICLSARDPILYAFELSWELKRLSFIENEFRTDYEELSQKCQKFCVHMLDQVRGSKELEVVLNHTTNAWHDVTSANYGNPEKLARLKLAIQLSQKRFVAHPNCQQLLLDIWYEGVESVRCTNFIYKLIFYILGMLSFPLFSLVYLLAPHSSMGQFAKKPFIKFLSHSGSYIFFLILLIMASQRMNVIDNILRTDDVDRKETRGPPPTIIECAIFLWVLGLIWVEIKQLWECGLYNYCRNLWNILDFITNSLYLCTTALRVVAYVQVEQEALRANSVHIARHLPRRDWDAWDPTLLSECFFATANIFSSLKLVHIFTVSPHLGPLKISLGRMVIDIVKFFMVYALVLFAFACGLNQLLWYYASMRQNECNLYEQYKNEKSLSYKYEHLKESCDDKYKSCSSIYHTAETLFWALFGLVDLTHFRLKEDHFLSEWTGKTIFGSYCCCSIIVLLNMLIAMMSNSYQYISDQADIEWKFARSRLFLEYFDDTATLPPPFNIVPSPKSIYYCLHYLTKKLCNCTKLQQPSKQKSMRVESKNLAIRQRPRKQLPENCAKNRYSGAQFHSRNKKKTAMAERRLKNSALLLKEFPVPQMFKAGQRNMSISSIQSNGRLKPSFMPSSSKLSWSNLKVKASRLSKSKSIDTTHLDVTRLHALSKKSPLQKQAHTSFDTSSLNDDTDELL
ncbi:Transient receptor ion channel domain-containing protein [Caenorhabditis elegans]|uniref:Transient receptor ion channel domain-containing protein n=1 Tax=Caenorhabditis elegans TaxID=6239 RepID=Q8I6Y9_CAEEL|nr:Transient receptor ion channel domain-containing protein [Caenorhabditis elegans]CCD73247.1 Transient receptor ion channel domain-containing protein [Caenorhabditis elegans]|eukprot:NP_001022703.1 TRP (transient receptor potential) channel family [Caenorhabditis elegans]